MDGVAAAWRRADGVVTGRTAPNGTCADVRYDFFGTWTLGGVGPTQRTGVRPFRDYADDDILEVIAAPIGAPAELTISPDGNDERLWVHGEQYILTDCEGQ